MNQIIPYQPPKDARLIQPADLIGAREAAEILGVDKSTLTRRINSGKIVPLAQLDGPGGAYVFDRTDVEREADQ